MSEKVILRKWQKNFQFPGQKKLTLIKLVGQCPYSCLDLSSSLLPDKRPLFRGGSGTGTVVESLVDASTLVLCALQLLVALVPARPTDQGIKIEPKMPVLGL